MKKPIRILHTVGGLNRGGAETWLMHVLRRTDPAEFQMDFLVHSEGPYAYAEEVRSLGGRLIVCPEPGKPWRYLPQVVRLMRENGSYDIVHSHMQFFGGFHLFAAARAGIPVRIAHSHTGLEVQDVHGSLARKLYLSAMKTSLHRYATHGLACSKVAATALFGDNWGNDSRVMLHPYGIDLSPFEVPLDPAAIRYGLGIPQDATVVGHVGRFETQKNHAFLVEIMREAHQLRPDLWFLLVGQGPLQERIRAKVQEYGLGAQTVFLQNRADIPALMRGAMDVFLFPSLWEGLPLVLLEAQAAGLPILLSNTITDEIVAIPELINWQGLAAGAEEWVSKLLLVLENLAGFEQNAAGHMINGEFDASLSCAAMQRCYRKWVPGMRIDV